MKTLQMTQKANKFNPCYIPQNKGSNILCRISIPRFHRFFISRGKTCQGLSPCVKQVIYVESFGARRVHNLRAHLLSLCFQREADF